MRSLTPGGIPVLSLNQKSAAGAGEAFAVPQPPTAHGSGPREVTWSYEPGAAKPTAVVIELRGAFSVDANGALVAPVVLDTYNTPGTATIRTKAIGKFPFLDLNILSVTMNGGDPIDGRISL